MTEVLPLETRARAFSARSRWLLERDSRLDSTAYGAETLLARKRLEDSGFELRPFGECVGGIRHPTQDQARSNFKRIWTDPQNGIPFLTGKQLFFFRPPAEKWLSRRMTKLPELRVSPGTILLSRSGTVGQPVLVGEKLSEYAVTDDALRILPGRELPGFTLAYLASKVGQALLLKEEYGSTVSHLEAKHIASLPVPMIPEGERERIAGLVEEAVSLRDRANKLLDDAEEQFHEAVGVSEFTEGDIEYVSGSVAPRAFGIRYGELGARFDAAHHVPTARSAVKILEKGGYPLARLGDRVSWVYVAPRFARIYVSPEHGVPLLQGSQLPLIRIPQLQSISRDHTRGLERWIIKEGWILVTCSGTIGRVGISTGRQAGWAASQHIMRIVCAERVTHAGFIATFLATPYGQHQLKAKIYGGVVDELTAEDSEAVLVPDVPYELQAEIGEPVVEAYELRDRAMEMDSKAVTILDEHLDDPSAISAMGHIPAPVFAQGPGDLTS